MQILMMFSDFWHSLVHEAPAIAGALDVHRNLLSYPTEDSDMEIHYHISQMGYSHHHIMVT
jgi:hypothetical protein